MKIGKSVSIYLLRAVLPYFLLTWLILTVVIFIQQAGRYSEVFLSPSMPSNFAWQIAMALVPNVIAFTCPMAVLVGVIIGLSRAIADNELVAIRAAGIGNLAVILPMALLGVFLSIFSIFINLYGVPFASRVLRSAALQTALYKLESPIEPGVINTEIQGYAIYLRDGNIETGQWQNVFVLQEGTANTPSRLITSKTGRVDTTEEKSELVLTNAEASSFKLDQIQQSYVSENVGEFRLVIKTRRDELASRLSTLQPALEEIGIAELIRASVTLTGREQTEARILVNRRIVLSFAPLLFAIFGSVMMLRFYRRGRGFGFALALASLVFYFLFTFAGEQLARTGNLPAIVGGLLPVAATLVAIGYFALASRLPNLFDFRRTFRSSSNATENIPMGTSGSNIFIDLLTGIRDLDIVLAVLKILVLALVFLASIFVVFTVFELWRFAGTFDNGIWLLVQYIFYLLPYIYFQTVPTAVLIAVLATYSVKSRQNEIVSWIAAGQSIYRLLLPCFALMLFLGIFNFVAQELIGPKINYYQDTLRQSIRNRGKTNAVSGKNWTVNDNYFIGFREMRAASDNGSASFSTCGSKCAVENITAFEIETATFRLQAVFQASKAVLNNGSIESISGGSLYVLEDGRLTERTSTDFESNLAAKVFLNIDRKPSHLSLTQIRKEIETTESNTERRVFEVALQKRYSTLVLPLIVALIAAPFGLGLDRKGRAVSIAYGVGLWFIFVSLISVFGQLGVNGSISAAMAVWAPLMFFALVGLYLISKLRT
ncbi:MAG: LptF/LptG family permease [Pyrinomonadaceae bacterium]